MTFLNPSKQNTSLILGNSKLWWNTRLSCETKLTNYSSSDLLVQDLKQDKPLSTLVVKKDKNTNVPHHLQMQVQEKKKDPFPNTLLPITSALLSSTTYGHSTNLMKVYNTQPSKASHLSQSKVLVPAARVTGRNGTTITFEISSYGRLVLSRPYISNPYQ